MEIKQKTAVITNVKYHSEINVTANYSEDFVKNWRINVNDDNAFLQLRMLVHDLLEDGFSIEWK
jgi:hypothetical protein